MTHKNENDTPDAGRRRLLGGIATTGAVLALGGVAEVAAGESKTLTATPGGKELDALLEKHIGHVVVIYAENRSFNNLFAEFPGLQQPLSAVPPERCLQRDRDGK